MAKINEIKGAVFNALGTVADKTKNIAGKAIDKAKDAAQAAKLNIEINNEKNNIEKAYIEIGKLYYETKKDDPDGFFIQLCDEITLAKERIETLSRQLTELKSDGDEADVEVEFTEITDEDLEVPVQESTEDCCCGEKPAQETAADAAPAMEAAAEEAPAVEAAAE